jgi:hypothetical protein
MANLEFKTLNERRMTLHHKIVLQQLEKYMKSSTITKNHSSAIACYFYPEKGLLLDKINVIIVVHALSSHIVTQLPKAFLFCAGHGLKQTPQPLLFPAMVRSLVVCGCYHAMVEQSCSGIL